MFDPNEFSLEVSECSFEHRGKTLTFYVREACMEEVLREAKRAKDQKTDDPLQTVRHLLSTYAVKQDGTPAPKEWVDGVMQKIGIRASHKITKLINEKSGLDDLIADMGKKS